MVPAGNKAKRLSLVNLTTKTIHHHHHDHHHHHHHHHQCFDYMVVQGHLTNKNYYTSPTRMSQAKNCGRMITYFNEILPIK